MVEYVTFFVITKEDYVFFGQVDKAKKDITPEEYTRALHLVPDSIVFPAAPDDHEFTVASDDHKCTVVLDDD